jgi:Calpain family cysteine protease
MPQENAETQAVPSWVSSLDDSVLNADMTKIAESGSVTEAQMAKLFKDFTAELTNDGQSVSASQFVDLQTIAANLGALGASSYVQYITDALIDGNIANVTYTGGRTPVALGDLAVGSSAAVVGELTGKWFLGNDNPAASVNLGDDDLINIHYKNPSLPLFGPDGPKASDINQGELNNCFLLSSLAEVAINHPSIIEQMIQANGNGTYSVKFQFGGHIYYVTVDGKLPDDGTIFNNGKDAWASLIEKAYAELPTSAQLLGNATGYDNSFTAYANGGDPSMALELITGATSFTKFDAGSSKWWVYGYDNTVTWTGTSASMATAQALSTIAADLAVGDDAELGSAVGAMDSKGNETLIADHAMSIYGYDASTGMLEIRNPWGTATSGQNWDTTFEVSLDTLLADGDSIEVDNMGTLTKVSNTSVVAAAGLQTMSQVTNFSVSDTALHVAAGLSGLEADTKLTLLTVNGTSGADKIDLMGFGGNAVIDLGTDSDEATLTGFSRTSKTVDRAGSINLGAAGAYDVATLGSGSETVDYKLGAGVLDVADFSAAHDLLSVTLGGSSLMQTIVGGSDWISSTTDHSHGVLLAGVSTIQKATTSGGITTLA